MLPLVIALFAAVIGLGAAYVSKTNDGPVEQACEEVIEKEIGVDVDLTPTGEAEASKRAAGHK